MARAGELEVVRSKTEPRCKICMHPHRVEIESLLIQRSKGEVDVEGVRINEEYIMQFALSNWDLYLSKENMTVHFREHLRYLEMVKKTSEAVAKQSDKLLQTAVLAEVLAQMDAKALLEEIAARGVVNMRRDEEAGIQVVTMDHTLKALDMMLKTGQRSALDKLIDAQAEAVSFVVDVAREKSGHVVEVEPVDAEVEDVE